MIKSENFIHACGILSVILLSVSLIGYTTKLLLFGIENVGADKKSNQIYDPDLGGNATRICFLSGSVSYGISYEKSACRNRTLIQWYVPWIRDNLWKKFRSDAERKRKQMEESRMAAAAAAADDVAAAEPAMESPEIVNVTKTTPGKEDIDGRKENRERDRGKRREEKSKKNPSEIVFTILVGLLVLSAVAAFREVLREKFKIGQEPETKEHGKECTLADFTMNRHLRRESQQQGCGPRIQRQASFDVSAKVTQTLIRQSSLDRDFPKPNFEAVTLEDVRRNSMPSYQGGDKIPGRYQNFTSSNLPFRTCKRQQSIDLSMEDINLELRKKPRHMIRRH